MERRSCEKVDAIVGFYRAIRMRFFMFSGVVVIICLDGGQWKREDEAQ